MINIDNIGSGWAELHIGSCSFDVSYLSNLVGEIDWLINLDENNSEADCKKSYLEGEGHGDLTLISYLTFDDIGEKEQCFDYVINIVWQRLYGKQENGSFALLKFPYKEFVKEWNDLKLKMKDEYIRNFVCVQDEREYEEAESNY